jgi:hypothetical protein
MRMRAVDASVASPSFGATLFRGEVQSEKSDGRGEIEDHALP